MKRILVTITLMTTAVMTVRHSANAGGVPPSDAVQPVKLLEVHTYCEGVVFDHNGYGYVSHGDRITQFGIDGRSKVWATTGAPNGHKVLADGTHLVCDASRHAVLHLDANGKFLGNAADRCEGKPLRGPNDLTLDPQGGFYFTDPGGSATEPIGTIHYVDPQGTTHLVAGGFNYPNGIVLTPDGKRLLMGESKKNRILQFPLIRPGEVGEMTVFANLPTKAGEQIDNQPDGICLDAAGNLYVAHYGMRQVQVLDPTGKLIARYAGGNLTTSNVAFGPNLSPFWTKALRRYRAAGGDSAPVNWDRLGVQWNQLYVTGGLGKQGGSGGGLFRLDLGVKGLVILPSRR